MKYNKQSGAVSVAVVVALATLAILIALIGVFAMSIYGAAKYANEKEHRIVAVQDNNKNIYANGTNEIIELARVPSMYAKDLKEIVTAEIQGKYGAKGSQATVQFLKDRNIPLTPELYKEIPMSIKKFHAKFESNQTALIDETRQYGTEIDSPIRGKFISLAGYPKIHLEDFKPVTSELTEQVYKTKKAEALKF